jgi:hypothetical protein
MADKSLKSFVFTLKNPHNIPVGRFPLKAEKRHEAIYCRSSRGPCFYGLSVCDNCNSNSGNWAGVWDDGYTNDIGLRGSTLFAGSSYFQVQEIEVFEITD